MMRTKMYFALLLMLYNWAMVCNLREGKKEAKEPPRDGFERLN